MSISNRFPKHGPGNKRLAIIGDCPSFEDVQGNEPFIGTSGRYLRFIVGSLNYSIEQCFIGNILQDPCTNPDLVSPSDYSYEQGFSQLKLDLEKFQPNCVLTLGKLPFRALNPDVCYYDRKGEPVIPLFSWRGSMFRSSLGWKALGTYHPSHVQRNFSDSPIFRFDVARAISQASDSTLTLPQRNYNTRPTISEFVAFAEDLLANPRPIGFDIEGICNNVGVTVLSMYTSPTVGISVPFFIEGNHYWSQDDETTVWWYLAKILSSPVIPKIVQNGLYELFVLAWSHRIIVVNIAEDTMHKHWELSPEFDRDLGMQVSLYTNEPYYKDDRETTDTERSLIYNAKDSACTFECSVVQDTLLAKQPKKLQDHYRFNINLIPALGYMSLRGVKLDQDRLAQHVATTKAEIEPLQKQIESTLGRSFNAKSNPDKQWLLYEYYNFEPYKRYGKTAKEVVLHKYYQKTKEPLLKSVIQLVNKRTRLSDLQKLTCDSDGRIRSTYDHTGTVTGRLASRASNSFAPFFTKTGILKWEQTGTNMQNQTKALRDCLVADEGFLFFQCDLEGADAWTVAADLAALGYPSMLDDLRAHIKPSKVLWAMQNVYFGEQDSRKRFEAVAAFNRLPREEIKKIVDSIVVPKGILADGRPADWQYISFKRVQHGTNYEGQAETIAELIFKDSDGLVEVPIKDVEFWQSLYKLRYNISARTNYIRGMLSTTGRIESAVGTIRKFNSIRNPRLIEDSIIREAAAQEPQANTTGVCNQGLYNLWSDTENRKSNGGLFVEPLVQVHDALCGQFHEKHLKWAGQKIMSWMHYPLIIHGIPIDIPCDGKYGPNWLDTKYELQD